MLISSLVALATFVLPRAAEALTLLPLGDGFTAGFYGEQNVCSYRYALQQLAATQGVSLEVLGSVLDSSEISEECSRLSGGEGLSGTHEGHFAATGADMYQKIESWISAPNYDVDQAGRLSQRVDIAVLSMGQLDCLNASGQVDSGNPYKKVAQGIKWALWSLGTRLPEGTAILVVPVLLPSSGVSETAIECAAWVNDKIQRPGFLDANVKILPIENSENLPSSSFVQVDGSFLPNTELSQQIASAIWKENGSAADGLTQITDSLPLHVQRSRMEDGEEEDEAGALTNTEEEDEDEYGYAWCLDNYDQNECFDYYYGYDWCTENYDKEECFDYYYGYDWCVKYYDQEECHDYYYPEGDADTDNGAVDTASAGGDTSPAVNNEETTSGGGGDGDGSGSAGGDYGYDWCLENYDQDDCFDYYYGYKWCLDYYEDDECYDYYYPPDFDWNEQSNYKWCLNFYLPDDCETRYYPNAGDVKLPEVEEADGWFAQHKGLGIFGGLFGSATVCGLAYWCYQKQSGSYSRLDPDGEGDELL